MAANNVLHLSAARKSSRLKQAVVVVIAIVAVGYGIALNGAHPPSPKVATAAVEAARPPADAQDKPRVTEEVRRSANAEDGVQREAEPRSCAPERGITEACIY